MSVGKLGGVEGGEGNCSWDVMFQKRIKKKNPSMSQNASSWKKRVTNALGNTCICLSHWMSRVDKTEFLCDSSAAVFSRLASSQDWLASFMILAAPDI